MKKLYATFICAVVLAFSVSHAQTTATFNYTGAVQTFVVPACVSSITVDISGAQGGGNASIGAQGGNGGRVEATMSVTPGQTLNIYVGGQGDPVGTPGYNGGGAGSNGSIANPGSGGGGASDIRINGTALTDRVIVAGGGGGGTENGGTAIGGDGGDLIGEDGNIGGNPWGCSNFTAATGGTQSTGGLGGTSVSCAWDGTNGTFGVGGNGYTVYRCAGGGGGWYGGGGAHNGASGGGGSSYTSNLFTNIIHTQGYRTGDGIVMLTYAPGPPATSAISGTTTLCAGSTVNYSIDPVAGATSYTWNVPTGTSINSGQGTTSINITTGSISGDITVFANSPCGSSPTTTLTITMLPLPNITATATSGNICIGSNDTLTALGASSYVWSSGGMNATEIVSPTAMTTYTVTGTDVNGCVNTGTVMVMVNSLPVVALGNDMTQCGGTVSLNAGNQGSTFLWSTTATTQTISVSSTGTYYVDVINTNGCSGSDTVMVTIHTLPTVTGTAAISIVCIGDASVTLTGSPAGGTWSGPGVTGTSFNSTTAGIGTHTVTYSFTDGNGCTGTATTNIQVNVCTGVSESALENDVTIFPNPNNGTFAISFLKNSVDVKIEIADMQGRVVFSSMENEVQAGFTKPVSMENTADGIYMVRVTSDGEQKILKISVQR